MKKIQYFFIGLFLIIAAIFGFEYGNREQNSFVAILYVLILFTTIVGFFIFKW